MTNRNQAVATRFKVTMRHSIAKTLEKARIASAKIRFCFIVKVQELLLNAEFIWQSLLLRFKLAEGIEILDREFYCRKQFLLVYIFLSYGNRVVFSRQ